VFPTFTPLRHNGGKAPRVRTVILMTVKVIFVFILLLVTKRNNRFKTHNMASFVSRLINMTVVSMEYA